MGRASVVSAGPMTKRQCSARPKPKNHDCRGLARAIRRVLEVSDRPMTANEVAAKLRRRFRSFSTVSMVERLDERCVISSFRVGGLSGYWVYTLHCKVAAMKAAGVLPEIKVWPVPDLRAILEDVDDC